MLEEKEQELKQYIARLDYLNRMGQEITQEWSELEEQKEREEGERQQMVERVERTSRLSDVEIQIELIGDSQKGREMLQQMVQRTVQRVEWERGRKETMKQEYWNIETDLKRVRAVERDYELLKQAVKEQTFHYKVLEDRLITVEEWKQRVMGMESLIKGLKEQIERNKGSNRDSEKIEIECELKYMKYQVGILREKNKQIEMMREMNGG